MSSIKRKGGERTYVPTCSLSPRKMTLMNAAVVMLKGLNMATLKVITFPHTAYKERKKY